MLLAPLARSAGGYGMTRREKGRKPKAPSDRAECAEVFEDTTDPDYQAILAAIREAKAHLDKIKRFDMPGFVPNSHYVRELKRYGIVPQELAANTAFDFYAAEREYWRSLWW